MKKTITCLVFLILYFSYAQGHCQTREITKEEIIQKATDAFQNTDYIYRGYSVVYDTGNKRWKNRLQTMSRSNSAKYEFLKKRNYQAVCFGIANYEDVSGDSVWFFIDKYTGEVLGSYASIQK